MGVSSNLYRSFTCIEFIVNHVKCILSGYTLYSCECIHGIIYFLDLDPCMALGVSGCIHNNVTYRYNVHIF